MHELHVHAAIQVIVLISSQVDWSGSLKLNGVGWELLLTTIARTVNEIETQVLTRDAKE